MTKNALALCVVLFANSLNAYALEILAEEEMSGLSAQDGITLMFQMPEDKGWRANSIALVDKNGIDASLLAGYTNAGKLMATNVGIKTCVESSINGSCTGTILPTLRFDVDAIGDHNNNGIVSPMLNVTFSLMGGANKIRFYIDKIALNNSAGTNQVNLIDFGGRTGVDIDAAGDYIDILPDGSKSFLNLQFGFETQGYMMMFANGKFNTIDFGVVSFLDAAAPTNSLRFGFKLDNVDLTGTGFDIDTKGLLYRATNFGGGDMDITISDIKMGGASAASMGTIGLQNISITNLAVTVSGKL